MQTVSNLQTAPSSVSAASYLGIALGFVRVRIFLSLHQSRVGGVWACQSGNSFASELSPCSHFGVIILGDSKVIPFVLQQATTRVCNVSGLRPSS